MRYALVVFLMALVAALARGENQEVKMEYWAWSASTTQGERLFSQSITLWRMNGKFDGFSGHRCSIEGAKETESPIRKLEFNEKTKQIRFEIAWNPPDEESAVEPQPDAVFDGVVEDKRIKGVLTHLVPGECTPNLGAEVILKQTMGNDDAAAPQPSNTRQRHEIRFSVLSSVDEISGGRVYVGGKGWAFVNGGRQKFKNRNSTTSLEVTVASKAAAAIRKCGAVKSDIGKGRAVQIVGMGTFDMRLTKNPDFPVGVFAIDKVTRCKAIRSTAAPMK